VSCRRPDGTGREDNGFVIVCVPVPACGAFDLHDPGVVRLDLARSSAGHDEDLDLLPQPADSAVELVRLRPADSLGPGPEFLLRCGRVGEGPCPQQLSELFLDPPHGLQHSGPVIRGKDFRRTVRRLPAGCLACTQEQRSVRRALVHTPAAADLDLLDDMSVVVAKRYAASGMAHGPSPWPARTTPVDPANHQGRIIQRGRPLEPRASKQPRG
jgi:hypothetical protein